MTDEPVDNSIECASWCGVALNAALVSEREERERAESDLAALSVRVEEAERAGRTMTAPTHPHKGEDDA